MANEKKEFTIIENADCIAKFKDEGFDNVVESIIGRAWGDKDKGYKVCLPVPRNDEEAARYNLRLSDLVTFGIQKLMTMVDFTGVLVPDTKDFRDDLDDEGILNMLQEAAEAYQAGVRAPGKAKQQKQQLGQLEQLAQLKGVTVDELLAEMKAKYAG